MEIDYTKREIDSIINGVAARFTEHLTEQDKTLASIQVQTTKTNGSVADLQKWRERTVGAGYVFLLFVVPILIWGLSNVYQLSKDVSVIKDKLSAYDITIQK